MSSNAIEQRAQRLGVPEWIVEGVPDGLVRIGERRERLGPVDDPAPDGEPFEPEALTVPDQRRRSRSVDLEDEAWPRAHFASLVVPAESGLLGRTVLDASRPDPLLRMSNTIFTAPRRPAAAACATASS